jgi:hypothetical protein
MSSYSFESPVEPNTSESFEQPKGLSTATMIATILMLVFGLSGLMGIIGLLASLATMAGGPAPGANPPPGLQLNAIQIGLSLFDLLLSIPLVVLSIMVLQRKRFAAVYLSWLALALALFTIPRAILTYILSPQIIESIKSGIQQAQQQQPNGNMRAEDIDMIMQIVNYALLGCSGVSLLATFLAYMFSFQQLRKPSTLERLSTQTSTP